ncbi:MAG: hypothetical protein ASARMPREDX12_005393 [Alectoria sarmentosa]|nr:MAG: hypothetical protein ASARMPREDX12_005393 [Alectoria sarmentosa]
MGAQQLSPRQAHALFDILTHHETYAEIQALKDPKTVSDFEVPGETKKPDSSASPLLQILLHKFVYVLPGLRDVAPDFWTNVKNLVVALAQGNLSESYDKGSIGIRKTLSTATASIVESVSRGCLGGYPRHSEQKERKYDASDPDDVIAAWDEFLQQIIYGDMLDRLFAKAAETDRLSDHEPLVQAAHEYAFTILGSFLHYIIVISPRGQSILPLLTKAHNLAPYFMIRQTLKVGNAASMLSGMVKLILAKMNMSTVTSWFGGQASDSGMNLMQQIISTVLSSDSSELKKRASAIEKDKDAPRKEHLALLKAYGSKPDEEQRKDRSESESHPESIVNAILINSSSAASPSEYQHKLALEYLSIQLAIRDREELIDSLCHHSPDLLTSSIRTVIPAYDPIIRGLHQAYDLSSGISDLENFLNDLISVSTVKSKTGVSLPPSVEDFCKLLQKHQGSSHKFIHQVLKNNKDLSQRYYDYAVHAARQYRQNVERPINDESTGSAAAGDFTPHLELLFSTLSETDRTKILGEIDNHAEYLFWLNHSSAQSMKTVIHHLTQGESNVQRGPGMYLSRWQTLMDETPITPATPSGPLRSGKSESVRDATTVDIDGKSKGDATNLKNSDALAPDASNTVRLLVPEFQNVLRGVTGK